MRGTLCVVLSLYVCLIGLTLLYLQHYISCFNLLTYVTFSLVNFFIQCCNISLYYLIFTFSIALIFHVHCLFSILKLNLFYFYFLIILQVTYFIFLIFCTLFIIIKAEFNVINFFIESFSYTFYGYIRPTLTYNILIILIFFCFSALSP